MEYDFTVEGLTKKAHEALEKLQRCNAASMAAVQAAHEHFESGQYAEALAALRLPRDVDVGRRAAAEQVLQEALRLLASPQPTHEFKR